MGSHTGRALPSVSGCSWLSSFASQPLYRPADEASPRKWCHMAHLPLNIKLGYFLNKIMYINEITRPTHSFLWGEDANPIETSQFVVLLFLFFFLIKLCRFYYHEDIHDFCFEAFIKIRRCGDHEDIQYFKRTMMYFTKRLFFLK